jgi:hypothetical protein
MGINQLEDWKIERLDPSMWIGKLENSSKPLFYRFLNNVYLEKKLNN